MRDLLPCLPILLALGGCADPVSSDLVLGDGDNWRFEATMAVTTQDLAEGEDATIRWDDLSTDLQQRGVDPLAIDRLSLVSFDLGLDELLDAITTNDLRQSSVRDYRLLEDATGRTSAQLSELSILGNTFDPTTEWVSDEDSSATWLLTLWDLDREGRDDILTSIAVVPSPGAGTEVAFTDESASFALSATFAEPLVTAAEAGPYPLDWSGLSTDASGHELDPLLGDQLLVMHTMEEVSALESDLIGVSNAATRYRMGVYGETSAQLGGAQTAEGEAFGGFTSEGTWLVGIECSTCTNPVPLVLVPVLVRE